MVTVTPITASEVSELLVSRERATEIARTDQVLERGSGWTRS